MADVEPEEWFKLEMRAERAFTPTAPIDKLALFAGRTVELRRVGRAIAQKGQHVAIYGERGVGKTSLATIINEALHDDQVPMIVGRVGCEAGDTYSTIWRKFFDSILIEEEGVSTNFHPMRILERRTVADELPETLTSFEVGKTLQALATQSAVVPIIDEFDQIASSAVRSAFSSTIKSLSDAAADVTIVLVGVADNITELVEAHLSAERAIEQVFLPRMNETELRQIVEKGLGNLGMTIDAGSLGRITRLSRGLPHYTHSLALHATRQALGARTTSITPDHIEDAIKLALQGVTASIISAYENAVASSHKDALFRQVLLACALAPTNEQGYFYPADVRGPMTRIMGEEYGIPNFIGPLSALCTAERGEVIQKTAGERPRYRFRNPMLQPYVILTGLATGRISHHDLQP